MPAPKTEFAPKVLIVDEEEGIRESLKLILGDHYDLILTNSAEQALRCLQRDPTIGLVLIGIKTPESNGLETLKNTKIKRPAIIISKAAEMANKATPIGAAGYIAKPFKSDEVLDIVRKYMVNTSESR